MDWLLKNILLVREMNKLIFFSSLIFLTSCSMFKMAYVHDEMKQKIDQKSYPFALSVLKTKVIERIVDNNPFGGKMISSQMTHNTPKPETLQKVRELMDDGFLYKEQLYTSVVSIDFSWLTSDLEKIKKNIFQAKYHILKDEAQSFTIVRGNQIYEGAVSRSSPSESTLKVFVITKAVVPLSLNIDWLNIIRGKGSFLGISESPVDFEASRKYEIRDTTEELSFYFRVDPIGAEKLESEILNNLNKKI